MAVEKFKQLQTYLNTQIIGQERLTDSLGRLIGSPNHLGLDKAQHKQIQNNQCSNDTFCVFCSLCPVKSGLCSKLGILSVGILAERLLNRFNK